MKLLLVRNGRPADRASFATSGHGDDLRPLSAEGRRIMRRAARGIAKMIGAVNVLASSPLARSVETAALLARELDSVQPTELAALAPGGERSTVMRWLARQAAENTIILVGHEPALGRLATHLLGGRGEFLRLKHGGACLLRFPAKAERGKATLSWVLTSWQLKRLGR